MNELPVVVVGAGPIGLAAAAHLLERGLQPLILEAGPVAAHAVSEWNHVRLFSRWAEVIDPASSALLTGTGWTAPDPDHSPTGQEWIARYLAPLAGALTSHLWLNSRVTGVARRGRDRLVDAGRETEPFTVHVTHPDGAQERISARAVIDASGTWGTPNPLGGDGIAATGEAAASARISYRTPDLTDPVVASRYAGRHTVVAGSGHSALTALILLAELSAAHPGTRISWLLRRRQFGDVYGGGTADQLPARGAVGLRARAAVEAGQVTVVSGFRTAEVGQDQAGGPAGTDRLGLVSEAGGTVDDVDEMIALTGFRPDLSWLSEVRLALDPVLHAPVALAPLIDPNQHSCGTVPPHGAAELAHPEPGLFIAGMKSYGRAPTFLTLTGYEQVRSIVAQLAGDTDGAARVELTLPDTGVCGGAGLFDDPAASASEAGGCCGPSEATAPEVPESATVFPLLGLSPQ